MCGTIKSLGGAVFGVVGAALGADSSRKAANRQADATIAAAEESATAQLRALQATARANADAVANMGRMEEARAAAATAAGQEIEAPEVVLDTPTTETAREGARRKRAQFGVGITSTGVQL